MSFAETMFETNGMNIDYFENLIAGDKLILVETTNEFSKPYQITIDNVRAETVSCSFGFNEFVA